jgi:hypothetical protein
MGDIIEYDPQSQQPADTATFANVVLRAEASGGVKVSARLPFLQLRVRNFAGQGVPVSMSWWDRMKAEPMLIVIWALIGLAATVIDWRGKLRQTSGGTTQKEGVTHG